MHSALHLVIIIILLGFLFSGYFCPDKGREVNFTLVLQWFKGNGACTINQGIFSQCNMSCYLCVMYFVHTHQNLLCVMGGGGSPTHQYKSALLVV